jgi:hypothetical protein
MLVVSKDILHVIATSEEVKGDNRSLNYNHFYKDKKEFYYNEYYTEDEEDYIEAYIITQATDRAGRAPYTPKCCSNFFNLIKFCKKHF